jgi:putative hemolysin
VAELLVILMLVVANGVFAGAEIALLALRKSRIVELAEQGRGSARAVLKLRKNPERLLATVQIGITVVSATAAAFGGAAIAEKLAAMLSEIARLERHASAIALTLVVVGVSFLSIVLGELVPKSLALRDAQRYALFVARPLLALSTLARPLVWLLSASANLLLKPFGDKTTFSETRYSPEELQEFVAEARKAGTLHPQASEIVSRALELPTLIASDVMVPRGAVVMISRKASPEDLRRLLLEHKFSRIPVYEDRVDNVVGYVIVKDVLALAWERHLIALEDIIRTPHFVPESKPAVELLNEMRAEHMPLSIVVDEHGGMSGIVTLEDLLEELVGEMFSEHASRALHTIVPQPDGSAIVSGTAPLREIHRALGIELPDDGSWKTVAGLFLSHSGHMPSAGEKVTIDGVELEVVEASARRIRSLRIRAKNPP